MVGTALNARLTELVNDLETADGWLLPESTAVLALVGDTTARQNLPVLETRFLKALKGDQMSIVSQHPDPYFVPAVLGFLETARSWRTGETVGQLLVQHAQYLKLVDLDAALSTWAANGQCRTASLMPLIALELLQTTAHLGPARVQLFEEFIAAVRAVEGAESLYRYAELDAAIATMS